MLDRLQIVPATPLPIAAQALQAHLQTLNDQAVPLSNNMDFRRELNFASGLPAQVDPAPSTTAPDVDVSGRITPLGIGDLKVVERLRSPMSPARWRISKTYCRANRRSGPTEIWTALRRSYFRHRKTQRILSAIRSRPIGSNSSGKPIRPLRRT